jgi:predicted ribonuclease YlaK
MTKSVDMDGISSFEDILGGVLDLLDSDEQQFIYLTGAAGTGKTYAYRKSFR